MHPDYPDLIKTALASDLYWGHNPETLVSTPLGENAAERWANMREAVRLHSDTEAAHHIGSLVTSIEEEGIMETLPPDSELPELHTRQVLRIIEDSRMVFSKFSLSYLALDALRTYTIKQAKQRDPNFKEPSFEDDLAAIYTTHMSLGTDAEDIVNYRGRQLAAVRRSVLYMRKDEKTGIYTAFRARRIANPETWDYPFLELIPDVKVGQIYSKNGLSNHLGRIISATVIEPTNVNWKYSKKPPRNNSSKGKESLSKSSKRGKMLRPSLS